MRHYFSKQCVTFGSVLLLSLASQQAQAQTSPDVNRPQQKALISLESNFISRWMSGDKADGKAAATSPTSTTPAATTPPGESNRKALLPPNSILNRNFPPATSPSASATPLPPTSLVFGPAPAGPLPGTMPIQQPGAMPLQQPTMLPGVQPMVAPIGTTLPPGVAQAQLAAAQVPMVPGQAPVIIMVPAGWQPEGSVAFAPRTIMSPEVPADHWPTAERNPFGDSGNRGMFTWPKFAKQMAGATLEKEVVPQGAPAKALFAAANNKPAAVQPMSKALFAPATAATPIAPPAPESRALFAQTRPAAEAKPAEATKSRALFAFGRKTEPASATATTQVANASLPPATAAMGPSAPRANSNAMLDANEAPPEAPSLSDFDALPSAAAPRPSGQQVPQPTEKKSDVAKPGMKWRAKGAPAGEGVVETVRPSSEAAEPTLPPTQIVEQVAPAAAEKVATAQPNAATAPAANAGQPATPASVPATMTPATASMPTPPAANQKALFASSIFSRSSAAGHALAPSRLAAAAPRATVPARPAEKAIVPNLMAMIPGLKDAGVKDAVMADESRVMPAAAVQVATARKGDNVSQASVESEEATARLTQSYYAPAVEHPAADEIQQVVAQRPAKRPATPVASSNRRQVKATQVAEQMDEPQAESKLEEPAVPCDRCQCQMQCECQPRQNQTGCGTPSNGARAAEQRSTKTYRRLTGKDVVTGLIRPFSALNQFTKLPPTVTRYTAKTINSELETFEQDPRGGYAHNTDDAVTSLPPLRRIVEVNRPGQRPSHVADQSETPTIVSDDETIADQPTAPSIVRGGGRRVVTPAVVREPVDDDSEVQVEASEEVAAEPVVKATRVRNKSGANVLIYSGADLSRGDSNANRRTSGLETSDNRRGNPLR